MTLSADDTALIVDLVRQGVMVVKTVVSDGDTSITEWTFTADDGDDDESEPVEDDLAYLQRRKGMQE